MSLCHLPRETQRAREARAATSGSWAGTIAAVEVVDVSPVGNYAYSIAFSDGHDTGIYTLEFLRELGTVSSGVK